MLKVKPWLTCLWTTFVLVYSIVSNLIVFIAVHTIINISLEKEQSRHNKIKTFANKNIAENLLNLWF